MKYRTEHDSMGEVHVPEEALYGAQTQRAVLNFQFSDRRLPQPFIRTLALVKAAAATANAKLGLLEGELADRIAMPAMEIASGEYRDQFPVDVFQTGSGTSTNMNMNEVLAHLAGDGVHPNDHVNKSQSSNDVVPTCIQASTAIELHETLLPAVTELIQAIDRKAEALANVVTTGRTHLMDAMPVTLGQELSGWSAQLGDCADRFHDVMLRLKALPLGGTAVGTGINCHPDFPGLAVEELSRLARLDFGLVDNRFSRMAGQEVAVECSAAIKALGIAMLKIANDLRWMSSGPLAGLGEIELKALQPGSSIMPGKVNPVIPEAVAMIGAEVIGNDMAISVAAQSGNFQLNVMLPLIAEKLLAGIGLLSNACTAMADTISDFTVNEDNISAALRKNPILVTALNSRIGYESAAAIAKQAYKEKRDIIDVADEQTDIDRSELEQLLDPSKLTGPMAEG